MSCSGWGFALPRMLTGRLLRRAIMSSFFSDTLKYHPVSGNQERFHQRVLRAIWEHRPVA